MQFHLPTVNRQRFLTGFYGDLIATLKLISCRSKKKKNVIKRKAKNR